jgi:hypothetical protein
MSESLTGPLSSWEASPNARLLTIFFEFFEPNANPKFIHFFILNGFLFLFISFFVFETKTRFGCLQPLQVQMTKRCPESSVLPKIYPPVFCLLLNALFPAFLAHILQNWFVKLLFLFSFY